jgi:hypothetical protein
LHQREIEGKIRNERGISGSAKDDGRAIHSNIQILGDNQAHCRNGD